MKKIIALVLLLPWGALLAQPIELKLDIFIQAPHVNLPAVDPTSYVPYPVTYAWGDGRTFGQAGTSRITQVVSIDPTTLAATVNQPVAHDSTTVYVTYTNGEGIPIPGNVVTRTADVSSVSVTVSHPDADSVSIRFTGSPSNPTVLGAPAINYDFTVTYNKNTGGYQVQYDADKFPSFEITANGTPLIRLSETSVWHLLPIFPSQTGTVTTPPFPFMRPSASYNNVLDFTNFTGGKVIWYDMSQTNLSPHVTLGPLQIVNYTDPVTGRVWER